MADNYYENLSIEQLKQLMNAGNAAAYYYYALRIIDDDFDEAESCIVTAVKKKYAPAVELYANIFYEALVNDDIHLTEEEINESINLLVSVIDVTSLVSLFFGVCYADGVFGYKDINKAIYYLTKAMNMGSAEGTNRLGLIYLEGPDEIKDERKAAELFNKAIQQGDLPIAYYNLAICYFDGKGVDAIDQKKGFNYMFRAALKGCEPAYGELANIYLEGIGVDKNIKEAIKWGKKALENGNPQPLIDIADECLLDDEYQYLYESSSMLAEKGVKEGQFYVGLCYDRGYYVESNLLNAIKYYTASANQGHASAYNNLALIYENGGDGVKADINKAIYFYKKSIALNNSTAMTNLALIYYRGDKVEQNYEEAFKYFKMAADLGSYRGQFYVGLFYDRGYFVESNPKKAMEYYLMVDDQDDGTAYNNIAFAYEHGHGVPQDLNKAIEYYEKAIALDNWTAKTNLALLYYNQDNYESAYKYFKMAADEENPTGQFYVGLFYDRGYYVSQDYNEALRYYLMVGDQDDGTAYNNIAFAYEHGHGVIQDLNKAIEYYEKAAEMGLEVACSNLGTLYAEESYEEYYDLEKAIYWYLKAVDLGSVSAMFSLGYIYDCGGPNVEQDYNKAKEWYEKAIEYDHPIAHNNLAFMYAHGYGVEKDINKAIELYEKATELGVDTAMCNLGDLYFDGDEVEQDYEKAYNWFYKAALEENSYAEFHIGLFYDRGYYVEQNINEAAKWYQRSIDHGDEASAYNNLAYLYASEESFTKDINKAIELYLKAIDLGNRTSMYNLARIYYEEEGYINYDQALYYAKMAYEKDYQAAEELINSINEAIARQSIDHVDSANFKNVFISWNHNDEVLKNKIVKLIEDNGFSVWESNSDCAGIIDDSCKKGVNGSELAIFLMTDNYFTSSWMCKELRWAYEKYIDNPILVIPIWIGEKIKAERDNPSSKMPVEFKWLSKLGGIFSEDDVQKNLIDRISNSISSKRMIDYLYDLLEKNSTYTMFLSNFVQTEGDTSIDIKHNIDDKFYISRTLYDDKNRGYKEEDVINSKQHLLIVGGGGMGKSLYLQKLICTFVDGDRYFYRFNIKEVAYYFKDNRNKTFGDFIISKVNSASDMPTKEINNNNPLYAFDKVEHRYILIDALDEFIATNEISLDFILNKISIFANKTNTHYIFTSRSKMFEQILEDNGFGNVLSLNIKELSDDEIVNFVNNIYGDFYDNNSFKKVFEHPIKMSNNLVINQGQNIFANLINGSFNMDGDSSSTNGESKNQQYNNDAGIKEKATQNAIIKPEVVIKSLEKLSDDIKRNPLLLSNFIILVMRDKRIPEKKVDIIEKSSRILFSDLEKARDATRDSVNRELLNQSSYFLEYIAFCRSNGNTRPVQDLIADAIRKNEYLDNKYVTLSNDLYNFFKNRAIIVGDENNGNLYHEIFKTYFTCRYIYRNVYQEDNERGIFFIENESASGSNRLMEYTEDIFDDNRPWIEVVPLLFTYLDYHSHQMGQMKRTYKTIKMSKEIVFDGEYENRLSKEEIINLINDNNLYNLDWFKEIFKID